MKEFYASVEWDILDVPAKWNQEYFPNLQEPYPGNVLVGGDNSSSHLYR